MEFFFFITEKERNTFFLDCLSLGIWVQINHSSDTLYGVSVDLERTFKAMYKGE